MVSYLLEKPFSDFLFGSPFLCVALFFLHFFGFSGVFGFLFVCMFKSAQWFNRIKVYIQDQTWVQMLCWIRAQFRNCNSALSALAKFDSDIQVIPLPCLPNYHLWEYYSVTLIYRELMNTWWDSQLLFNHSSFMSWWNLCWYAGKIAQHWNVIVKTKLKVNEVAIKSRRRTEEKYEIMIENTDIWKISSKRPM